MPVTKHTQFQDFLVGGGGGIVAGERKFQGNPPSVWNPAVFTTSCKCPHLLPQSALLYYIYKHCT